MRPVALQEPAVEEPAVDEPVAAEEPAAVEEAVIDPEPVQSQACTEIDPRDGFQSEHIWTI